MEIANAIPAASAAPAAADAAKDGKSLVSAQGSAGNTGSTGSAGSAGSAKKTAFKDILDQVNSSDERTAGSSSAQDSSAAEPQVALSALAQALLVLLQPQAAQTDEPAGQDLLKLVEAALAHPEELNKLLQTEDGQAWLAQAAQLLGAMGYLQAGAGQGAASFPQATAAKESAEPAAGQALASTSAQTANPASVLAGLLAALKQEPDSVLVAQIGESFAKLLSAADSKKEAPASASAENLPAALQELADKVQVQVETKTGKSRHAAASLEAMTFRKGLSAEQAKVLASIMEEALSDAGKAPATVQTAAKAQGESATPATAAPLQAAKADAGEASAASAVPSSLTELPKSAAASVENSKPEVSVNLRNFADDVSAFLLKNAKPGSMGALTEARLLLKPEHLGAVDVRITLQNGQLVAHFAAQQSAAKDALENQMTQLRASLQSQGYQVERLEVTHSPSLQSGMFQGEQGRQFSRQSGQNGQGRRREGTAAEEEEFTASLQRTEQLRRAMAGTTVDITA